MAEAKPVGLQTTLTRLQLNRYMARIGKGLSWLADLIRIFAVDRFHPERKRFSLEASTACRSLKFHAHSKIKALELKELLRRLSHAPIESVQLPGVETDLGNVGNHTYYFTLASLVKAVGPKTILEFGTYLGVSAFTMALNCPPDCRIFTVDLADQITAESDPTLNEIDRQHISTSRYRVGEAFLRSSYQQAITQIRADSMTFQAEKSISHADLVLVDGGHSLALVTKDTENAFKVLSPDGMILWDDYFHLYPDVVEFLDRLSERYQLYGIAGTNLVVYSPRLQNAPRQR